MKSHWRAVRAGSFNGGQSKRAEALQRAGLPITTQDVSVGAGEASSRSRV